jgi:nicotinate-nucleotide adenylyltransferase
LKSNLTALGIVGGTFDPIHYGHLNPVKEAVAQLNLKQVHFIPAANPPHRATPTASAQHRLAMLELALKDYPEFISDDRELTRSEISYTINTLKSFRQEFGNNIPVMLFIGADAFSEINTWYQWQLIPDFVNIIVMARPNYSFTDLSALGGNPDWVECKNFNQLNNQAHGLVFFHAATPVNISATKIRSLLVDSKKNESELLQALPAEVYAYISEHNLYTPS